MIMIASKAMVDGRRATRPLNVGMCVGSTALFAALVTATAALSSALDLRFAERVAAGAALSFVAYAVAPVHRRAPAPADARSARQHLNTLGFLFDVSTAFFNPITASSFARQSLDPSTPLALGAATGGIAVACGARGEAVARVFSATRWRAAALRHENKVSLALCAALAGYAGWTAEPQLAARDAS